MVCTSNARLVSYQHNLGPEKKTSALSVIIARFWALKVIAKFGVSHCSKIRVALAIALHIALALLLAIDLSTINWFHSAYTSVSMFSINVDNYLFLCS